MIPFFFLLASTYPPHICNFSFYFCGIPSGDSNNLVHSNNTHLHPKSEIISVRYITDVMLDFCEICLKWSVCWCCCYYRCKLDFKCSTDSQWMRYSLCVCVFVCVMPMLYACFGDFQHEKLLTKGKNDFLCLSNIANHIILINTSFWWFLCCGSLNTTAPKESERKTNLY